MALVTYSLYWQPIKSMIGKFDQLVGAFLFLNLSHHAYIPPKICLTG